MILTRQLIFEVEALNDSIARCGQYWTARILSAGTLQGCRARHDFVVEPDIQTGGDGLVLSKLALGMAIAQQLGMDAHPGFGAGEVVWVTAGSTEGTWRRTRVLTPVRVLKIRIILIFISC